MKIYPLALLLLALLGGLAACEKETDAELAGAVPAPEEIAEAQALTDLAFSSDAAAKLSESMDTDAADPDAFATAYEKFLSSLPAD